MDRKNKMEIQTIRKRNKISGKEKKRGRGRKESKKKEEEEKIK